jgi:hypothetical protein
VTPIGLAEAIAPARKKLKRNLMFIVSKEVIIPSYKR